MNTNDRLLSMKELEDLIWEIHQEEIREEHSCMRTIKDMSVDELMKIKCKMSLECELSECIMEEITVEQVIEEIKSRMVDKNIK